MAPSPYRGPVPCGSCTLCCYHERVYVMPHMGDDVNAGLDTEPCTNPLTGRAGLVLKQRPDGACIHLGDAGCTVYDRRPAMCRTFDCRRLYLDSPRAVRRRHEKKLPHAKLLFARGRELVEGAE